MFRDSVQDEAGDDADDSAKNDEGQVLGCSADAELLGFVLSHRSIEPHQRQQFRQIRTSARGMNLAGIHRLVPAKFAERES